MPKSMKNIILLAKSHVTAGVDPVPAAATNAILVRGFVPQPIKAEFVDRSLIRGFKGNFGKLMVGNYRMFEFEVELAGAGAAGTAPAFGPLLKACHWSETVNAGISVVYAPVENITLGVAMYAWIDGARYIMLDAQGSVEFAMNAKQIPVMRFKFMGAYQAATDTVNATGLVYTAWTRPLTVGKVNTPTFTLHGLAGVCESLSFDQANQLQWRDLIGANGPYVPDRSPSMKAVIELPTIAAKDFAEVARLGTEGAVQVIHGTTAGNIIQIDAPKAQVQAEPQVQNAGEVAMLSLDFSLNPNAGSDEIVLTVK